MDLVFFDKQERRELQSNYITRVLRDNIIFLHLSPGQVISENDIRSCFHTSRTPVREAFINLAKEQLLEVRPQLGTYVSLINKKWIEHFLFMRATIEKEIVKLVCVKQSSWLLTLLTNNLRLQEEVVNHNPKNFLRLDKEFHACIYQHVDRLDIWNALDSHQSSYDRLRSLCLNEQSYKLAIEHHWKIYEALKKQDEAASVSLVEQHVGTQFALFSDQIHKNHSLFC